MGEPAYQLPEDDRPDIRPDLSQQEKRPQLGVVNGGGETTPRAEGHLKSVGGGEDNAKTADDLGAKEAAGSGYGPSMRDDMNEKLGKGYNDKDKKTGWSRLFNGKSKVKKRIAIAGVLGAGSIGGSILLFTALLPFKIESIINDVDSRAGAAESQAIDTESQNLFKHYVQNYIVANLGRGTCHSTVDNGCVSVVKGDGPVKKLYRAWRNDKLEQKLATKYDLSFGKSGGKYYINTDGQKIIFGDKESDVFHSSHTTIGQRHEIEAALTKHLKEGTLYDRIYYRFKLAPFVKTKYGLRHCVNACKAINKFTDSVATKKKAAAAYIIQRVITPLNQSYGLILQCVLAGAGSCDTSTHNDAQPGDTDQESPVNKQLQQQLDDYAANVTGKSLEDLAKIADDIAKNGFEQVITKAIVSKIASIIVGDTAGEAAGQTASDAVPFVGWAILIAKVVHGAQTIGPTIRYMSYAANAAAAVQMYAMYQTVAAEGKSGQMDSTQLGSFGNALSTNLSGSSQDRSDATQTPLYQSTIGKDAFAGTQTALLSGLGTSTAYAAGTTNDTGYICPADNNKPVPAGKKVCADEVLDRGNNTANDFSAAVNSAVGGLGLGPIINALDFAGGLLSDITGPIFDGACNVVPGCKATENALGAAAGKVTGALLKKLVSSPITKNMSGGRTFDMIAAGGVVSHNTDCQETIGCAHVSSTQAASIQNQYIAQQQASFSQRPLFARMFSTDTPYSLVSHLAVGMPTTLSGTAGSITASILHNPFAVFGDLAGGLLGGRSVSAATPSASLNQFGVPDMAFTDVPADPDAFFQKNCMNGPMGVYDDSTNTEDVSAWLNNEPDTEVNGQPNTAQDPNTGTQINLKTNACLLILSGVQATGGLSDVSLLPQDVLSSDGTSGAGASFRIATFNVQGASHTPGTWRARADKSIHTILSNNLDIVGLQEWQTKQLNYFMGKIGSTYDRYPKGSDSGHATEDSIIWDKSKFDLVKGGTQDDLIYFCGEKLNAPWIELQTKPSGDSPGGQQFLVYNTHDPANASSNGCNGSAAKDRYHDTLAHLAMFKEKAPQGLPIFFTGDFNSGYCSGCSGPNHAYQDKDSNTDYCVLGQSGLVNDAYDLAKKRPFKCHNPKPSPDNHADAGGVDHIFMTKQITVSNHIKIPEGTDGADHPAQIFDVTIPGSGDASSVSYQNSVFKNNVPDPTIVRGEDGTFQIYTTGNNLQHLTSKNMVDWTRAGKALTGAPSYSRTWAPDVAQTGDHYTLSYAASNGGSFKIVYATSPSIAGPFSYRGTLLARDSGVYDLDPKILQTSSGLILYYGSGGRGISAIKLKMGSNGSLSTIGSPKVLLTATASDWITEGAWVQQHAGYYYLYYSVGSWKAADQSGSRPYRVKVARSQDPFGSFEKHGDAILKANGNGFTGPGHNSTITDDAGQDWMIYHAWNKSKTERQLMLDRITYVNGWPVVNGGNGPSNTNMPGPMIGKGNVTNT